MRGETDAKALAPTRCALRTFRNRSVITSRMRKGLNVTRLLSMYSIHF